MNKNNAAVKVDSVDSWRKDGFDKVPQASFMVGQDSHPSKYNKMSITKFWKVES